mgnify:CR=1 FL=1
MYLNEFADGLEPRDMRDSEELASLLQSARELGIPHSPDVRYASAHTVVRHQRFHYLEWGAPEAPPVLLLHGGNQSAHSFDLVSLHLADRYRVVSPPSIYGPLPEGSVIEGAYPGAVKGATSEFVSDGVFLMLAPLPKGEHTLRFGGSVRVAPQDGIRNGVAFDQDITYHLIVR